MSLLTLSCVFICSEMVFAFEQEWRAFHGQRLSKDAFWEIRRAKNGPQQSAPACVSM